MPAQVSSDSPSRITPRSLWFGTTAAAIAWALHGVICEVIADQACKNGIGSLGALSPDGVRWLLAGITIGFLAIAVIGGLLSFRNWMQLAEQHDLVHAEGSGREQFMALVGVFMGATFAIGIIWAGLPLIFLDICMKAR
jgi:hypothetical protein